MSTISHPILLHVCRNVNLPLNIIDDLIHEKRSTDPLLHLCFVHSYVKICRKDKIQIVSISFVVSILIGNLSGLPFIALINIYRPSYSTKIDFIKRQTCIHGEISKGLIE